MKNNEYGKSKAVRFLTGRGFYFVLGLCMVAIGIAAWSMASTISNPPITGNLSSGSVTSGGASSKDHQTGVTASGINASSKASSSSKGTTAESSKVQETTAPVATGYALPVTGEVLKMFNEKELQYSKTYNDQRLHLGIDIAANAGTAIKAAGSGRVTKVIEKYVDNNSIDWGTTVVIDHGNGVIGYYCGLTNAKVKAGQNVNIGDTIASLGQISSESSDPPHLHLAFTKDGKPISPLSLVNMDNSNG